MSGALLRKAGDFRRDAFASLENPNYRTYVSGQIVSNIGNWMQTVGQSWLVLQLTGSPTMLGLVVALQTLPVLLLGPYGGVIADRANKRRLMIILQAGKGLLALTLGLLAVTHVVHVWHVFVLACLLGLDNAFENPTRQSFVLELVGRENLRNAVSLNSVIVNVARAVGPAVAGLIIAGFGVGFCFLANAASFLAVITSLLLLDSSKLMPSPPAERAKGQIREGIAYVRRTPQIGVPLVMMAVIGCLAYEFQVVLPIVAKETFDGDSKTYGFMTAAMGIGAIVGGLWVAARGATGIAPMVKGATGFGIAILAAAAAPTLHLELAALVLVGFSSVTYLSKGSSTMQLASAPTMRGRVMSLWAVAMMGSTPIGGPLVGSIAEHFGARSGLVIGGVACLGAAAFGAAHLRSASARAESPAEHTEDIQSSAESATAQTGATGPLAAAPSKDEMVKTNADALPA